MTAPVFDHGPARVYWELTRACDLACRHCRAEAVRARARDELTTAECQRVLRELAAPRPPFPHVIFTGGDPLKRLDLLELVMYGVALGLPIGVAPSATPGLSHDVVADLKTAGAGAMSLSLDGSSPARHDTVRGVFGCFGWTLAAAERIVNAGIPLQINTLVSAETEPDLEEIAKVVARLGASRWSLFFLVSVGRGRALTSLSATEAERTLRWVAASAPEWPFAVTTTEAPHYRRVVIEAMRAAGHTAREIHASPIAGSFGVRDGNGIMFIGATGDVTPSGFLPVVAGNVRQSDPLTIYRKAELFRALRAPDELHGRCGVCPYRSICGGSRARAYAATGDALGEDPLCAWEPGRRGSAAEALEAAAVRGGDAPDGLDCAHGAVGPRRAAAPGPSRPGLGRGSG